MKIYLEYKDDKSQKFWEVWVEHNELVTRYGNIGNKGIQRRKKLSNQTVANYERYKAIASKKEKGYGSPYSMTMDELCQVKICDIEEVDKTLYSEELSKYCKKVIFIEEDLTIDELDLDILKTYADALIIKGNLTVNGGITNTHSSIGAALVVRRNIIADYLIAGGSMISLCGDTLIYSFVIGHYNDGTLFINNIDTFMEINADHDSRIDGFRAFKLGHDEPYDIKQFKPSFIKKADFIECYEEDDEPEEYCSFDVDILIAEITENKKRLKLAKQVFDALDGDIESIIALDGLAIKNIENPSDALKILAVKNNGNALEFIENPTEEMKLIAVKNSGYALKFITSPSEEMMLLAIENTSWAIRDIHNPSEKMKLLAIENYAEIIQYIDNPTDEMKLLAIENSASVIEYIENPTNEMKTLALKNSPYAIKYIDNPTDDMKTLALEGDGYLLKDIENPTEEMKLTAIENNAKAIKYIENQTEKMKLLAINNDVDSIAYVENPTDKMKFFCVKKDCTTIRFIKNPNEDIQNYIMKKCPYMFEYIDSPTLEIQKIGQALIASGKI